MLSLDLSGRTALIGGSTQGIGLATAQALASLGAACILLARNEEKLKTALAALPGTGRHRYIVADYSDFRSVEVAVGRVAQQEAVHILVNNTGGPAAGTLAAAKPEDFLNAFQQHLICNHVISNLLVPKMKEAGYGRIINIVSTSVKIPLKGLGVSNTIRGAVASWAKTMANELGAHGITVNNVLPGATSTGRLDAIISNKSQKTGTDKHEVEAEMIAEIPAGRFGRPEEIAAMAAFLASPAAAYVNGVSIPVDGGRTGSI